jgi:CxxC-x17-CxxC domain-containing protein
MDPQYQDQVLTCRDCGNTFVWTASEQKFYAEKGFANPPVRCPQDRAKRKAAMGNQGGYGGYSAGPRQMYDAVCSVCGKPCQVPFQPKLGEDGKPVRPIYCNEHYQRTRI